MPKLQHSAKETLLRARPAHSAKFLLCRVPVGDTRQSFSFAECQVAALGKGLTPSATPTAGARRARVLGTCAVFAECGPGGTRQRSVFAECPTLPTVSTRQSVGMPCACWPALGKAGLCRVPVVWHSAKTETLGNYWFSGSVESRPVVVDGAQLTHQISVSFRGETQQHRPP